MNSRNSREAKNGFVEEMQDIKSGHSQLTEVEELESGEARKLVEFMREVQAKVDEAIQIEPNVLGEPLLHSKEVMIGADAVIIGTDSAGKRFSKLLSDLPPATILAVAKSWAPKMRERLERKKNEIEERLYLIEEVLGEFKGVKTVEPSGEPDFLSESFEKA